MAKQKASGLPKRTGNVNRKARRAASWARGQARKLVTKRAQAERTQNNVERRLAGQFTPWESAKAIRAEKRAAKRQQIHAPAKGMTA
jgi:GAF domain-containing protein